MTPTTDITTVVCFSPDEWGDVKRPQQLMVRLASRAPVVYVEPPLCVTSLVKRAFGRRSDAYKLRVRRALTGRVDTLAPGVSVVTPLGLVPEHMLTAVPIPALRGWLERAMSRSAARRVRAASAGSEPGRRLAWVGYPTALHLASIDPSTLVVYDCVDRWSDFPGPQADSAWRARLARLESALLARADEVFCSAQGLYDAWEPKAAGKIELLRNAADVDHFRRAGRERPDELVDVVGSVIGYIGAVAAWLDFELLAKVAQRRPEWTFAIVGPLAKLAFSGETEAGLAALASLENVRLLGGRPYDRVPAYLEAFDVALIPFQLNGLTEDTNPIKLYEYLAGGVQVVSTPLPEVCGVPGVLVGKDAEEFERQIEVALARHNDPDTIQSCIEVAEQNSWESRAADAWEGLIGRASARTYADISTVEALSALRQALPVLHRPAFESGDRPKVLAIATDMPWPLDSGWRIRALENLRMLSGFADVTLVFFCESDDPSDDVAAIRAALPGVRVEPPVPLRIHIKENPLRLIGAAARGFLTGLPYKVAKFSSREMAARLKALPELADFDAVHVELATLQFADVAVKAARTASPAIVLDTHNVESQLLADHCDAGEFGGLTPAVRIESQRTRSYEARACSRADLVLAISEEDAGALREFAGSSANIVTIPPVAEAIAESDLTPIASRHSVLFVGQLSWLPNQEAVRWLCETIMPRLRAEHPDVSVEIVGGGAPPALVKTIHDSGALCLGYVDDLADVYSRARVYLSPFLTGGGVRIKLLEAMRYGVPIVSTQVGAKGLSISAGRELLVAETPDEFVSAIESLLEDAETAGRVADAAREYLAANHSRAALGARMRDAYRAVRPGGQRRATADTLTLAVARGATAGRGGSA